MPHWSAEQRAPLSGAGHAASPFAGKGATVAMVGCRGARRRGGGPAGCDQRSTRRVRGATAPAGGGGAARWAPPRRWRSSGRRTGRERVAQGWTTVGRRRLGWRHADPRPARQPLGDGEERSATDWLASSPSSGDFTSILRSTNIPIPMQMSSSARSMEPRSPFRLASLTFSASSLSTRSRVGCSRISSVRTRWWTAASISPRRRRRAP